LRDTFFMHSWAGTTLQVHSTLPASIKRGLSTRPAQQVIDRPAHPPGGPAHSRQ
jgi:hypothetical protein